MNRIVAWVAIAAGVALIAATLGLSLLQRTTEGERLLQRFRFVTTDQGFHQFGSDYTLANQVVKELQGPQGFPAIQQRLGLTDAQFNTYVKQNYPFLASAVDQVKPTNALINPIVAQTGSLPKENTFGALYDLPVRWLPLTSVPWLMLGLAAILLATGAWGLSTDGRGPAVVVLVTGLAVGIGLLAFSIPSRAHDAAKIIDIAKQGVNPPAAAQVEQTNRANEHLVLSLQNEVLPDLARKLHTTPAALLAGLPVTARYASQWPRVRPETIRFGAAITSSVDDLADASKLPYKSGPWIAVLFGFALAIVGGIGLLPRKREAPHASAVAA